jgi:multisubunit Na+/H+ antiporter MnhF subunit
MTDLQITAILIIVICSFGLLISLYRGVTGETRIDRAFAAFLCALSTYAIGTAINKVWGGV